MRIPLIFSRSRCGKEANSKPQMTNHKQAPIVKSQKASVWSLNVWNLFGACSLELGFFSMKRTPRGFTLIELLVVLSIMLVITGVFLVRNQQFNSAILLRSLSYQVALSIRQAQVFGVGVKEDGAGTGNFSARDGVQFS